MIEDVLLLLGSCLLMRYLCNRLRLPHLIGYLLMGMLMGPFATGVISDLLISQATDIKRMALAIILIRAGLTLDIKDLKTVGPVAIRMSFLPATFEIVGASLIGHYLIQLSWLEAFVLGVIIAAVSPAVVVPRMIRLLEQGLGVSAKVPQIILAGSSLDDIYTLVLFSMALLFYQQGEFSYLLLFSLPVSICLGILLALLLNIMIHSWVDHHPLKSFEWVLLIFLLSLFCLLIESRSQQWVSGLLAVIFLANRLKDQNDFPLDPVKKIFNNIWLVAEMFLFFLVGAILPLQEVTRLGVWPIIFVLATSVWRMVGVYLSLAGSQLSAKEKVFVLGAYLPKATVQAAIGSIPLTLGMPAGNLIFSLAVIEILLTAPLGAWWIDVMKDRLLTSPSKATHV